jgi:hypothetical protein
VRSRSAKQLIAAVATAAIVVLAAALAQTAVGKSVLRDTGLLGAPEGYTELEFVEPAKLPAQLTPGTQRLRVPFRIHNVEGGARTYRWSIVAISRGHTRRVAGARQDLAKGQSRYLDPHVPVACNGSRVRIEVRLAGPAQSIGFWVKCNG